MINRFDLSVLRLEAMNRVRALLDDFYTAFEQTGEGVADDGEGEQEEEEPGEEVQDGAEEG